MVPSVNMAFAQSVILGSCSFLLGMVFVCQVVSLLPRLVIYMLCYQGGLMGILQVDIPLLYMPVTDQALQNAYTFYEIWYEAPGAVKVCSSNSAEGCSRKWGEFQAMR